MRIIAGKHKGLNLFEFNAENIRPTLDRVRENIFNKIQFEIKDSIVLDLFAGTGSISIEFLSRGAKNVITCDNNKKSVELIKKNFLKANEDVNLKIGDFKEILNNLKSYKFDIIYLDPPYNEDYGQTSLKIIAENNMLEKEGIIVYEHLVNKEFELPLKFEIVDEKKYGTISVSFIRVKS